MNDTTSEHFDVLIVGAGLSGIGAAHHLQDAFPGLSYVILEARETTGGTWDLFRYPGVRSDSDMYTLGYRFRPWTDAKAIADGPSILAYVRETAAEAGIDKHIRFRHRVSSAEWSTEQSHWIITALCDSIPVTITASFLYICSGYYHYDKGYLPDQFASLDQFGGAVVHPQHWPEDLDYDGKRVVVIGSGATVGTLAPAMAEGAARGTMLQRSPTYLMSAPAQDVVANKLRGLLSQRRAYQVTRWKNVALQILFYKLSRRRPGLVRNLLRKAAVKQLPPDFDVDTHFNPRYNPWDQRLCLIPDGDLYQAIRKGKVSVATGEIAEFTKTGVTLKNGEELEADIIVTATGLRLLPLGGIDLTVDGVAVKLPETMAYKGLMLGGVPNMVFTVGYTNASWTLKADLVSEYTVRLLRLMRAHGYTKAVPVNDDPSVSQRPLLDFQAGYILRSIEKFPKAGSRQPWQLGRSYAHDVMKLRYARINDGTLRFTGP